MKKIYILIIALLFLIPFNVKTKNDNKVTLYLFHRESCPHCKAEIKYLDKIKDKYDYLEIKEYEVSKNKTLYQNVIKKIGTGDKTPITIIGSKIIVGFADNSKSEIERSIKEYNKYDSYCDLVTTDKSKKECQKENKKIDDKILSDVNKVPLLGEVNVKTTSLFLIAMVIGLVDGFNPCAMWVLIFLISLLIEMKDKKKMVILGLAFILASGFIYTLFMVSWLKITNTLMSTWFRYLIALVALIAGIINVRNYMKMRKSETGCTVTKKEDRKKIMKRIQNIIHENNFFIALVGIIILACSVNLIELACSSALPTFFITILGMNDLNALQYAFYIFVYILFFLLDDIIVFLVATLTFKMTAISNKFNKYSHLIGGVICLLIGILLAFFPNIIMFSF